MFTKSARALVLASFALVCSLNTFAARSASERSFSEACAIDLLDLVLCADFEVGSRDLATKLETSTPFQREEFLKNLPPKYLRSLFKSKHPRVGEYLGDFIRRNDFSVMDDHEFAGIAFISERILSAFPPEKTAYVGMGRSPAPFIEYLKAKGAQVSNVALSNFNGSFDPWAKQDTKERNKLSEEILIKFHKHLDQYFPLQSQTESKDVVLVDYSITGSIFAVKDYVDDYLRARGRAVTVHVFAVSMFSESRVPRTEDSSAKLISFPLGLGAVSSFLSSHGFDGLAAYGEYDLSETLQVVENPYYGVLKREILARTRNQGEKLRLEDDFVYEERAKREKRALVEMVSRLSICRDEAPASLQAMTH